MLKGQVEETSNPELSQVCSLLAAAAVRAFELSPEPAAGLANTAPPSAPARRRQVLAGLLALTTSLGMALGSQTGRKRGLAGERQAGAAPRLLDRSTTMPLPTLGN